MTPFVLHFRAVLLMALLFSVLPCVFAGGGPQNVLIVANANSTESLEIANAYRRARDIPYSQVVTLTTPTAFQVSYQTYLDEIETPIRTHLQNHQLTDEICYIVLTRGVPQMVSVENGRSVASLLATMGLQDNVKGFAKIDNPYFNVPDAFSHQTPSLKGIYLVTVLNGYHTEDILKLIANGMNADGTCPGGRFVLQTCPQYNPPASELTKMLAIRNLKGEIYTTLPEDRSGLMSYFSAGAYSGINRDLISSFKFSPGAIADLAQNFSAAPSNFDQVEPPVLAPVSWFVQAGITGIHGVVGEAGMDTIPAISSPQQLLGKYTNGFTLAESYYAALPSLHWQNMVIGDPLCSPYVQRPLITAELGTKPVKGIVPIRISATSPVRGNTISRIDAYVDDHFVQTIYQPDRTRITLYIGEEVVNYTVPHGATLRTLLYGLADTINADPILSAVDGVRAIPSLSTGTIILCARKPGAENNEIPIGLDIENDTSTPPCVMGRVEGGWLSGGGQDPTPASAIISFMGRRVKAGDRINLQIQQEHFTYTVPTEGATISSVPESLAALINDDPILKEADGVVASSGDSGMPYLMLHARTPGECGNDISFQISVQPSEGSPLHVFPDSPTQLTGGYDGSASIQTIHFMLGEVTATGSYLLNTTELADGFHRLRLVAYDGSLSQAQGTKVIPFTVNNLDTPPAVSIPESLPAASGSITVPVTANPSVTKVDLFVDGQLLGSSTAAPFDTRIPLTSLGRGLHDLWAEATDAEGHRYVTAPTQLQVLIAPEVFRITPNYTATSGGTTHQIIGTGFQRDTAVKLAGVQSAHVTYISPNLLEVTSTASPARQGLVEVTNTDGTVSSPNISFEYYQPRVDDVQITPKREVLTPGQKIQFTAKCFDQHNFPIKTDLTWETNGGTISTKGAFTAGKKFGTYLVRASHADSKKVWEIPITIGPAVIPDGSLLHWLVLGPFPDPTRTALETPLIADEQNVQPSHGDMIDGLMWHSLYSDNGFVDFMANMTPNTDSVVYAHVYIYSPDTLPCSLVYGSDDGIRIWSNHELIQSLRIQRAADPNQNTTPIILKSGWNSLLVKVDQGIGGWGMYMRLKANDGSVLPVLKYSLDCPTDLIAK